MTLSEASVGVVVTRRVPLSNVKPFEEALRDLMQIAAHQPGQVAGHVLRGPRRAEEQEYFIVYRFADEARLRTWEESPERQALVARIDPLTVSGNRSELTGLEAWFDLPTGLPSLSIHRIALLTWVGIWPLVSLALWLVAPHLVMLPFLIRTGITSGLLVLAMTYFVMPRLARLAAPWLARRPRDAGARDQSNSRLHISR